MSETKTSPNEFDFSSLETIEIPVVGPNGISYTLREASGKAAVAHRNAVLAAHTFVDGKLSKLEGIASVEPRLVAACLWDEKGRNPPVAVVEGWPARVQKALFEKIKEISDMAEADPQITLLINALGAPDSPVSPSDLRDWVLKLEGKKYKDLRESFKDVETEVKNEPSDATAGSE